MWFLLSLGNAFFESIGDACAKSSTAKLDPWAAAWIGRVLASLLLLPCAFLLEPQMPLGEGFWTAWGIVVGINTCTSVLYLFALRDAPLSLALPLLKLSPMFLLLTGPLITGEHIPLSGVFGVLLTVMGTYALNLELRVVSFLEPFLALWRNRGTRCMLFVALLWGISAPWDKIGVHASGPLTWLLLVNIGLALALLPLYLWKRSESSSAHWYRAAPIAVFSVVSVSFQMSALLYAPVQYVISVKRVSALFGMLWGKLFFGEDFLRSRVVGALFILAGMVTILFSS